MKKNKITNKQSITENEIIMIVEKVVSGYFQNEFDDAGNATGKVIYTPYFRDKMLSALFVQYCTNGIEFEEGENPYLAIIEDDELMSVYDKWKARCSASTKKNTLYNQMLQVEDLINDKLEVEKKKYIADAGLSHEVKTFIRLLDVVLELQKANLEKQEQFNNLMTPEEQVEFAKKIASTDFSGYEIAKEAAKLLEKEKAKDEKVVPIKE